MRKILIFGGTGFVGTQVVQKLASAGHDVLVATRNVERGRHLQPFGNVGQIACFKTDLKKPETVEPLFEGVDAVINLIGILFQKKKNGFQFAHTEIPKMLAELACKHNVPHFVQMSALGVDRATGSKYAQSRLAGEKAVLEAFPNAMITRPSIIIGPGDGFFNMFNGLSRYSPFLPLIGGGKTKFQPVYVDDVAQAIMQGIKGKTGIFELGGPEVYSFRQLLEMLLKQTGRQRFFLPAPMKIAKIKARFFELMPKPLLTRDQVELLKTDNIVLKDTDAKTFADLEIKPTPIEAVLPTYLS